MKAKELLTILKHIGPETPIKIEIHNGEASWAFAIKDPKELTVKFQEPDGAPVLLIEV